MLVDTLHCSAATLTARSATPNAEPQALDPYPCESHVVTARAKAKLAPNNALSQASTGVHTIFKKETLPFKSKRFFSVTFPPVTFAVALVKVFETSALAIVAATYKNEKPSIKVNKFFFISSSYIFEMM